ncbi:MAG: EAL domain-containing protein [Acidobacteria bacterium]|nr:EAL domain-containing protein [Acidobacteriota bacterium]
MGLWPTTSSPVSAPPGGAKESEAHRILVVDEATDKLESLRHGLAGAGYEVNTATTAGAALEQLRENNVGLILLGESVPGMTGLDLLRLLRAAWTPTQLPVIVVAGEEGEKHALEAGANDCIACSTDSDRAVARVRSQLRQRDLGQSAIESAERFQRATTGSVDVVWEWNLATNTFWFSAEWSRLTGRASIGPHSIEDWLAAVHPSDAPALRQALEEFRQSPGRTDFDIEYRVMDLAGREHWVFCRANVERDRDGALLRLTGLQTDVSRTKNFDALTQLPNRESILSKLDRMLRDDSLGTFAILMIDIDRFRFVNESLGSTAGDRLLREIAIRLERVTRTISGGTRVDDLLARLHGDTFLVVLCGVNSVATAQMIAERLQVQLRRPFAIAAREIHLSASMGLAMSSGNYENAFELLRDAEFALRQAKSSGQARAVAFDMEMRRDVMLRMELELDLREAIAKDQLVLYYQPKVDLVTGALSGFEALIRWNHPVHGLVPPLRFIPIAEETGQIIPIGWWTFEQAARQLAEWRTLAPELDLQISANLSVRQFFDRDLVQRVGSLVNALALPPQSFCLEVTESVLIDEINAAADILHRLHDAGVGLMIDDFGTGYSSLNYLGNLPFDALKIDRSFVSRLTKDDNSGESVKTVINLAKTLKMATIAEGIETTDQAEYLKRIGCEAAQGYLFAKPVPAAEAARMVASRRVAP